MTTPTIITAKLSELELLCKMQKNKAERHLRGGEATRLKYLHK